MWHDSQPATVRSFVPSFVRSFLRSFLRLHSFLRSFAVVRFGSLFVVRRFKRMNEGKPAMNVKGSAAEEEGQEGSAAEARALCSSLHFTSALCSFVRFVRSFVRSFNGVKQFTTLDFFRSLLSSPLRCVFVCVRTG